MLVSEDEPSFLIKKKKRERKERGEQFPVGVLTVPEAGQSCRPLLQLAFTCRPLWRRSLTDDVQNHFYKSIWALLLQADLGFKEIFAPHPSAFKCEATTASISKVKV